jgi:tetratricopeptide (TPR) repeat protein
VPVAEAEIELPEIDRLDTPFKKRVAISAALLVLLGGVLALGASRAGEKEQTLSADAQAASIRASAGYGKAFSEISKLAGSDAEARSLRQRAELARVWSNLTGAPSYSREADAFDRSAQALTDLTAPDEDAAHWADVNREATARLVEPRENALRADALRESATAWGAKADRYILGITLLAVALSLLGLSLTLAAGTRGLVVLPAALIAVFAVLVSVVAASQHPSGTPDPAVRALAEGDRLMTLSRYDDAVDAYTEAIRLRADYAPAYRARGTAQAIAGSPETSSYVFTTVDEEARERSIADLDRALELSPVPDYLTLVNQGANLFHVQRYAESEELTRRALDINDRLPLPWANLALAQAAQGDEDAARETYGEMIGLTLERPDPIEQQELFASSRSTLEILALREPSEAELAGRLEGMLVAAQAQQILPGPNPAGPDAQIANLELSSVGAALMATYDQADLPTQSRISWIGYFRPSADEPWQQRARLVRFERIVNETPGRRTAYFVDDSCPGAGEYRLDAWLDDRLLATDVTAIAAEADRYAVLYEASSRVTACRPVDWDLDDAVPGVVRLTAPGPEETRLTIRAVPRPAELLDQAPERVAKGALSTEPTCNGFGPPAPDVSYNVGYVSGVSRQFSARADGQVAWCWAGLGLDGLLRVVVAEYATSSTSSVAAVNDLVGRLHFNDAPPT